MKTKEQLETKLVELEKDYAENWRGYKWTGCNVCSTKIELLKWILK